MRSAIAVGLEEALDTRIEDDARGVEGHLALAAAVSTSCFRRRARTRSFMRCFSRVRCSARGSRRSSSAPIRPAAARPIPHAGAISAASRRAASRCARTRRSRALPATASRCRLRTRPGSRCAATPMPRCSMRSRRRSRDGARVLLQIMDSSKLGWRAPSEACLDEIARRWPDKVLVVVDACQMRLGRRRLRSYLDRGYMVLITGSKFFGGPAFSGALLVPSRLVAIARRAARGSRRDFVDYASRSDWPKRWTALALSLREPAQFRSMAALGSGARGDRRLLPGAGRVPRDGAAGVSRRHREPDRAVAVASPDRRRCGLPAMPTTRSSPKPRSFRSRSTGSGRPLSVA